jgi:lysine-ketoglutarate reductase/saccharopine dehydrogenase-like protein (TIGR00300 family)
MFEPLPADGVLPEGFFATTNLPTYVHVGEAWIRPRAPRMDGVIVRAPDGGLVVSEARRLARGVMVAMGMSEDGSNGILVHTEGFLGGGHSGNEFQFMSTEVSRERPVDYDGLAAVLCEERRADGFFLWVAGPALVHSRARDNLVWFIEQGYVQALLAGNALAVHDLEAAIHGTTLGMTADGEPTEQGHSLHMRTINTIRAAGSIEAAVGSGIVSSGIMHALVQNDVPYVLAGSIRDDGPLPGVITGTPDAQDAMRAYTMQATGAVFLATALHAIAVGNMLPAFVEVDNGVRSLPTICVDNDEFVVNKLRDRGTHQAFGVVTNAQDFMQVLRIHVEQWEQAHQ